MPTSLRTLPSWRSKSIYASWSTFPGCCAASSRRERAAAQLSSGFAVRVVASPRQIRYKPGGPCLGTEGWMRRWLTSAAALALIFAALFGAASLAHAQRGQTAGSTASLAGDLGWPRDFDVGSDQLEVYQPQIETWQGDRMSGR